MRPILALAVFLAGCPTPPTASEPGAAAPKGPAAPGKAASGGPTGDGPPGGGPPGGGPPGGGPPAGGPPAGAGDPGAPTPASPDGAFILLDVPVQHTQAALAGGVSGTVTGACTGKLVIDLVPPGPVSPTEQPEEGGDLAPGPVTRLEAAATGDFELLVPKGATGDLAAACDQDGDGVISSRDLASKPVPLDAGSGPVTGVALALDKPVPPGMDSRPATPRGGAVPPADPAPAPPPDGDPQ